VASLAAMPVRLRSLGLALAFVLIVGACGGSSSARSSEKSAPSTTGSVTNTENIASLTPMNDTPDAGAERLHYKVGPFTVEPGQNNIANRGARAQQPPVDGWIVGIRPNLEFANGKTPGVDVIHLHHAVWLNLSASDSTTPGLPERFFAVGEEKTILKFPAGYGYAYKGNRSLAARLHDHNLTPTASRSGSLRHRLHSGDLARGQEAHTGPADLDGRAERRDLSVFNVPRGGGQNGEYTYPDNAKNPTSAVPPRTCGPSTRTEHSSPRPVTYTPADYGDDSGYNATVPSCRTTKRNPVPTDTVHLFSSVSHYYEPPARCRGTSRCRRLPTTGACRCTRATSSRSPRRTNRNSPRGTRAWASWWCGWRTDTPAPIRSPHR